MSFGWYSSRATPVIGELLADPDDGWIYMYHGYTRPEHRGGRLHGNGLARALVTYGERGKDGIVGFLELTNDRSERSALRVGFRRVGFVFAFSIGKRRHVWATSGCAHHGVRVSHLDEDAARRSEYPAREAVNRPRRPAAPR